jgi:hypothetical protein
LGNYQRGAEVLEPLLDHDSGRTRAKTHALLLECYENLGEILKAADLKRRIKSHDS